MIERATARQRAGTNEIKTMQTPIEPEPNSNLDRWLTDARTVEFFGPSWQLKADILRHLIEGGGSLAEIARQHHVSRSAVSKHFRTAKAIWQKR